MSGEIGCRAFIELLIDHKGGTRSLARGPIRKAGPFCEPTGATVLAAACDLFATDKIGLNDTVVRIVTHPVAAPQ